MRPVFDDGALAELIRREVRQAVLTLVVPAVSGPGGAVEVPQLLGLTAAGELLGVSSDHVLRLARAGVLDLRDVRAQDAERPSWRVTQASVGAWLESRRVDPVELEDAPVLRAVGQ